jgi:hypothetical protein
MTKVLPRVEFNIFRVYESWEENIIAPKLTLKGFADELHYYLRSYLATKKKLSEVIFFLFLNATQRIFYSFGTFSIKIRRLK